MKSIEQLEHLITGLRLCYVRKYAKLHGWCLEGLADEDLMALYTCLEIKEKFAKRVDKEHEKMYNLYR